MDIQTLLSEIHGYGLTDTEIGEKIGTSQSIVYRLRTGKHSTTSYERGRKIEALATSLRGSSPPEASTNEAAA